jgi:hypothetical protein
MLFDIESLIDEFLGSQQFLFLPSDIKEYAAGLLAAFASGCAERGVKQPGELTIAKFEDVLMNHLARLDLPLAVRRGAPGLLRDFFDYLAGSGRFPPASAWVAWVDTLDDRYQAKFRDDGSLKGETFTKKYTDVNRNDPCPCGSGKKFKKCCLGLIG